MSKYAEEVQPMRMVEYSLTLKVVILTENGMPTFGDKAFRNALVPLMPAGTGVGSVTCIVDGPIMSTVKP